MVYRRCKYDVYSLLFLLLLYRDFIFRFRNTRTKPTGTNLREKRYTIKIKFCENLREDVKKLKICTRTLLKAKTE